MEDHWKTCVKERYPQWKAKIRFVCYISLPSQQLLLEYVCPLQLQFLVKLMDAEEDLSSVCGWRADCRLTAHLLLPRQRANGLNVIMWARCWWLTTHESWRNIDELRCEEFYCPLYCAMEPRHHVGLSRPRHPLTNNVLCLGGCWGSGASECNSYKPDLLHEYIKYFYK